MSQYLLLYTGGDMPATEEDSKAMVKAWEIWLGGLGEDFIDGNPFTSHSTSVSPDGSVSDGPVGPIASGYSMVKGTSMDAALEIARRCPAKLSGASISIFEVA